MALALGASHAASGTGHVAIARPLGLVVTLSTIPAGVAVDPTDPATYHRLGTVALGSSLGYAAPQQLLYTPQLVYPLADDLDRVAWSFRPGIVGTIQEIVRPAVANSALQPWDRGATFQGQTGQVYQTGPTSSATLITYTVPAGYKLWLGHLRVRTTRLSAATANGGTVLRLTINGLNVFQVIMFANTIGADMGDELHGGAMVLPAGSTLSATASNTDTGGQVSHLAEWSGFIFAE